MQQTKSLRLGSSHFSLTGPACDEPAASASAAADSLTTQTARAVLPSTALALYRPQQARFLKEHGEEFLAMGSSFSLDDLSARLNQWPEIERFLQKGNLENSLSHVLGDSFASKTYEGWNPADTAELLHLLLSHYAKMTGDAALVPQKLIDRVASTLAFVSQQGSVHQRAKELADHLQELPAGSSILIPAGYRGLGTSGHAVLVELTANRDSTFEIALYNTGEGGDLTCAMVKDCVQVRMKRTLFSKVPKKKILTGVHQSSWLLALLEPCETQVRHEYNMDLLHKLLFSGLTDYHNAQGDGDDRYFRAQLSGTCGWKMWMAWLHFQLPRADYKTLASWIKATVLAMVYRRWLESLDPSISLDQPSMQALQRLPTHRQHLLHYSAQALLHHVQGRLRRHAAAGGPTPEPILLALKVGKAVLEAMHQLYDFLRLQTISFDSTRTYAPSAHVEKESALIEHLSRVQAPAFASRAAPLQETLTELAAPLPIVEGLQRGLGRLQQSKADPLQVVMVTSRWILHSFPPLTTVAASPWSQLSSDDLQRAFTLLTGIQRTLIQSALAKSNEVGHWALVASYKLLALTHYLACLDQQQRRSCLFSRQKFAPLLRIQFLDRFALSLDPSLGVHIQDALAYMDRFELPMPKDDADPTCHPGCFMLDRGEFQLRPSSSHAQVKFWFQWLDETPQSLHEQYALSRPSEDKTTAVKKLLTLNGQALAEDHPAAAIIAFKNAFCFFNLAVLFNLTYVHKNVFSLEDHPQKQLRFQFEVTGPPEKSFLHYHLLRGHGNYFLSAKQKDHFLQTSLANFPLLLGAHLKLVVEHPFFNRTRVTSEESAILSPCTDAAIDPLFGPILQRGQSEPSQTPGMLLYYFSTRLERLADKRIQALFLLTFFKTLLLENATSVTFPLADDLRRVSFRKKMALFLKEALLFFKGQQASGLPDHETCCFLVVLATMVHYLLHQQGHSIAFKDLFGPVQKYLDTFLEQSPSIDVRAYLHLCQAMIYSRKDPEDRFYSCEEALFHWVSYQGLQSRIEQRWPWLEKIISSEIFFHLHPLVAKLTNLQMHALGMRLFGPLLPQSVQASDWRACAAPHGAQQVQLGLQFFRIDYTSGTLSTENGALSTGQRPSFFDHRTFQGLFGKQQPIYSIAGDACHLTHKGRTLRCLKDAGENWFESLELYDEEQGRWLQFTHEKLLLAALPRTVARRYFYFFDAHEKTLFGFDRRSFHKKVHLKSGCRLQVIASGLSIAQLTSSSYFAGLEEIPYIEYETDREGREYLFLPRLQVFGGSKLRFQRERNSSGDRWRSVQHPAYYLDQSSRRPALLGVFTDYIPLISDRQERLVFVPLLRGQTDTKPLSSDLKIFLPGHKVSENAFLSLDGTIHLMPYQVRDDLTLVAKDLTGHFYLGLLFLYQKSFEDAYRVFSSIELDAFSEKPHKELLEAALSFFHSHADYSPQSLGCLMLLITRSQSLLQAITQKELPSRGTFKWVCKIYQHYLTVFDRLPASYRLLPEEELHFCQFLNPPIKGRISRMKQLQQACRDHELTFWETEEVQLSSQTESFQAQFQHNTVPNYKLADPTSCVVPHQLPLTVPRKVEFSLSADDCALALSIHDLAFQTDALQVSQRLEHFKLWIEMQLKLSQEQHSRSFCSLLGAMVVWVERRRSGGSPLGLERDYLKVIEYLKVGAKQIPAPYASAGDMEVIRQLKSKFERDFFLFFELFINAHKAYFLQPQTLVRTRLDSRKIGSPLPGYAKHAIEWKKPKDLHGLLLQLQLPPADLKADHLLGHFNMNHPRPLQVEGERALAKAHQSAEEEAVQEENRLFLQDLERGRQILQSRPEVAIDESACIRLRSTLSAILRKNAQALDDEESQIVHLLNRLRAPNHHARLADITSRFMGESRLLTIQDGLYLFLRGSREGFKQKNPSLDDESIDDLMLKTACWLTAKTEQQHLQRLLDKLNDYESHKDTLGASYYAFMLYNSCMSPRAYEPAAHPQLLVYEYFADLRLREEQVVLIEKMRRGESSYRDVAIQLIMGGGKTEVLAATLLADSLGLAIFMTPESQYATVKKNLRATLKKCFNLKLIALEIEREELHLQGIRRLQIQLNQAMQMGFPVICKPQTLQTIQLEFLSLYHKVADQTQSEQQQILHELASLLTWLKAHGHVLIDEVDLVLDTLKEVNFPGGSISAITPCRIELQSKIFEILVDPSVFMPIPGQGGPMALCRWLRLKENEQDAIDVEFFRKQVTRVVARELIQRYPTLNLQGHEEAFIAFVCEDHEALQTPQGERFFRYLHQLSASSNALEVDTAHLIALAKHILYDVLPSTLKKSCGRNYGRSRVETTGKVIPFQCVDTPSTSEFGYHVEAACYQFQTAIQEGIGKGQIQSLAQTMAESASKTAKRKNILFSQTPEALEFLEMTGCPLHQAKEDETLTRIVENLQQQRQLGHFKNILKIEAETILTCVKFHEYRLSSGPQAILSMFASRRVFSGIPWNIETYPTSLKGDNYLAELGTQGQIVARFLDQASQKQLIHAMATTDPVEMIEALMRQYPDKPQRVSLLLDPAGLFKAYNNRQIAYRVRDYLRSKGGLGFKGVLFFTRPVKSDHQMLFEPKATDQEEFEEDLQATPDELAFISLDSDELLFLAGTDKKELAKHNLYPGDYFVIDDERHTTGTNILMCPDAVAAMTFDESLTLPRMCQAQLRLRQYLFTQEVHVMVLESLVRKRQQLALSAHDIISMSLHAQAMEKQRIMLRSFYQKVDNVFRDASLDLLFKAAMHKNPSLKRWIDALSPLLTYYVHDDPVKSFGHLNVHRPTVELLETRFQERARLFERQVRSLGYLAPSFERQLLDLCQEASQCAFLTKETKTACVESIGVEQQVEQVALVEVEQTEQAMENEREILQDLEQINKIALTTARQQQPWSDNAADDFLHLVQRQSLEGRQAGGWKPYMAHFGSIHRGLNYHQHRFELAIDQRLLCTLNFAYTDQAPLPLFHYKLRPASQMLMIQCLDGSYRGVLISLAEADFWQRYIENRSPKGVWLVNPHGRPIGDHPLELDLDDENVQILLVMLNAIEGQVDYLNDHLLATKKWLAENPTNKIHFVKFCVLRKDDALQKYTYQTSEVFNYQHAQELRRKRMTLLAHLHAGSTRFSEQTVQALSHNQLLELDDDFIELVGPHQVGWLLPGQISLLKTRQQIQAVPLDKVHLVNPKLSPHLTSEQIPHLGKSVLHLQALTQEQVDMVSCEQVAFIKDSQIPYLKKPELIQALNSTQLSSIIASQLRDLKPEQIPFLPLLPALMEAMVDDEQLKAATPDQLDLMSQEKILAIKDPAILANLGPKFVQAIELPLLKYLRRKEALQALTTSEQINALDPCQVAWLADKQLKFLYNQACLATIEDSGRLQQLDLQRVARQLSPRQLQLLPLACIAQLPLDEAVFEELQEAQLHGLTPEQVQSLTRPGLVQRLGASSLVHLLPGQFYLMSPDQRASFEGPALDGLRLADMEKLRPSQLAYLRRAELIQAVAADWVQHLKPAQVVHLRRQEQIAKLLDSQVDAIDPSCLDFLSDQQLACLSNPQLIQRLTQVEKMARIVHPEHFSAKQILQLQRLDYSHLIPSEQFDALSPAQLRQLERRHLSKLKEPSNFQHLALHQLAHLTPEQVKLAAMSVQVAQNLPPEQLTYLLPSQVAHLTLEQMKFLKSPELIGAIPLENLDEVLQPGQVPWLNDRQLYSLQAPAVIAHVPLDKVDKLSPAAFAHLSYRQQQALISHAPLNRLRQIDPSLRRLYDIPPSYFEKLCEESILDDLALMQALSDQQRAHIPARLFCHLSNRQVIPLLNSKQLAHLDADLVDFVYGDSLAQLEPKRIQQLAPRQIHSIQSPQALDLIVEKHPQMAFQLTSIQLQKISNKKALAHLSPLQLADLNPGLIRSLSWSQLQALPVKGLKKGSKLKKVALAFQLLLQSIFWIALAITAHLLLIPLIPLSAVRATLKSTRERLGWNLRFVFIF